MKWTQAAEILAGFLQADVFAHNPNDIGLLFYALGNGSGFGHRLWAQFYNRNCFSAAFLGLKRRFRDKRLGP